MERLDDLSLEQILRTAQPNTDQPAPPLVDWAPGPDCPRCRGAGYYLFAVDVYHPLFGKLQTCECQAQQQQERQRQRLRERSGLQPFARKTFDQFDSAIAGIGPAFAAATQFALAPSGFLVLVGPVGCGKTHLAQAVGNVLQDRGADVVFTTAPDALRMLRATFEKTSEVKFDQQFELLRGAGTLIVDDLGAENTTDWGKETLFQLINERYEFSKPTVVTSNLHPGTDAAQRRFGMRLCSRLQDRMQGRLVVIQAEDYRLREPMQRGA